MAMLNYQQEAVLFSLNKTLVKSSSEYDYFEMLDLFRQLEAEGYVDLTRNKPEAEEFMVQKTDKGLFYHYNWLHTEFR